MVWVRLGDEEHAITWPTNSSLRPSAYISAVSISVSPRSTPSRSVAISSARVSARSAMFHVPCMSAGT